MKLFRRLGNVMTSRKALLPYLTKQACCIKQATTLLVEMSHSEGYENWKEYRARIKSCEKQGDSVLSAFQEELYNTIMTSMMKSDLASTASRIDDFLDNVDSCSDVILLYSPNHISSRIKEMAALIDSAADALLELLSCVDNVQDKAYEMITQCDRIAEIEHETDAVYAEYIEYLFREEKDAIEIMRFKNIAEMFEGTLDSAKAVGDDFRRFLLRYTEK